ncbi:MAG: type II toxin-antitoxin system HicA family toxin [Methylococcales bacterium]
MGKLGNISGKQAVKVFQKLNWQPIGQVGSHVVMVKPGMRVTFQPRGETDSICQLTRQRSTVSYWLADWPGVWAAAIRG